eukprot:281874-Rhodomonas_salina.2
MRWACSSDRFRSTPDSSCTLLQISLVACGTNGTSFLIRGRLMSPDLTACSVNAPSLTSLVSVFQSEVAFTLALRCVSAFDVLSASSLPS